MMEWLIGSFHLFSTAIENIKYMDSVAITVEGPHPPARFGMEHRLSLTGLSPLDFS